MAEGSKVVFSVFPRLDQENLPDNSMANAERWATGMPGARVRD
jgi:dipeptidase E